MEPVQTLDLKDHFQETKKRRAVHVHMEEGRAYPKTNLCTMHISNPPIDLELTSEEKVAGNGLHSTHHSTLLDEQRRNGKN